MSASKAKSLIHFAHGNGFPSPCYRAFLQGLQTGGYKCFFIDRSGHNKDYPVDDNWPNLVDELILSVKSQAREPVFGVGHSLGGILTVLAAKKAPELFRGVVMLDSPLTSPFRAAALQIAKRFDWVDQITPALNTKGRRSHWPSKEEAVQFLRNRGVFKTFSDECLRDYVEFGTTDSDDEKNPGCKLRFDVNVEYSIYRTVPHTLSSYPEQLTVPTVLVYGTESDIVHPWDRAHMLKKHDIKSMPISGTHMFPFERPQESAKLVLNVLQKL